MTKLENLILYILNRQPMEPLKLGIVLYLVEREHYLRAGTSLAGTSFVKHRKGPLPRNFGKILAKMVARGDVGFERG